MSNFLPFIPKVIMGCGLHSAYILFASETVYVTSQLQGQLGNQMFQIAAAVAYGIDHHCEYRFPQIEETINGILNHHFVFHRLNTSEFPQPILFNNYYEHEITTFYKYVPIPYTPTKNICIQGYYLNEKYFSSHAETIKNLFAPKKELLQQIQAKYGEILKNRTVAVHVRTYIPDGAVPERDGIGGASWNYYINAINYFPEEYTFLIFSDCPEWTKKHFPRIRKNMQFIEGNPHYFDFYFMSICDHQITSSKSTFSWWASWLNSNPDKIIVAPENYWGVDDDDGLPTSWVRVKCN